MNTTLSSLTKNVRLTFKFGASLDYYQQDEWQREANGYRCTLRYHGRQYTFDYWMGSAHTAEPDVESVLDSLLSDSQAGEESFADFCGNFGYDEDSRKAERVWKACQRVGENMRRLLGDDYETFLYADRN